VTTREERFHVALAVSKSGSNRSVNRDFCEHQHVELALGRQAYTQTIQVFFVSWETGFSPRTTAYFESEAFAAQSSTNPVHACDVTDRIWPKESDRQCVWNPTAALARSSNCLF
jgi:hypothetical protein